MKNRWYPYYLFDVTTAAGSCPSLSALSINAAHPVTAPVRPRVLAVLLHSVQHNVHGCWGPATCSSRFHSRFDIVLSHTLHLVPAAVGGQGAECCSCLSARTCDSARFVLPSSCCFWCSYWVKNERSVSVTMISTNHGSFVQKPLPGNKTRSLGLAASALCFIAQIILL